jgi:hypothetical protein
LPSDKIDQVMKAYCSKCGGERNCSIAGHHAEGENRWEYSWHQDWYLLVCRGCDNIFAQSVSTNSEDIDHEQDENGEWTQSHAETIRTWPARSRQERPEWFSSVGLIGSNLATAPIVGALNELYSALDNNLNVLAGIGLRTTFDIVAEKLNVNPDLSFAAKLDHLVAAGLVSAGDKEHLAVLVDAGSASAHRGLRLPGEELDVLMRILEGFIFKAFVEPRRAQETAEKIARIRSAVPGRAARGASNGPAPALPEN